MTQRDRIRDALARGPVYPIDYLRYPTIDGGPPILRVAARVHELRQDGHQITETRAQDGTAVYTLAAPHIPGGKEAPHRASPPMAPPPSAEQAAAREPSLFDPEPYARPGLMDAA